MGVVEGQRADLTPYVPRLVVEWLLDEPERLSREVDGTMAFVDISGFTALSERLAEQGKAGAEKVTEVMNATFARLLEVAYGFGGGLLKFGGDALLLFFSGPEHASRAAAAAVGMREALAGIDVGPDVALRMHVGVHSDRFAFYLVGASHRELVVTGPAATATVAMEAASEAGEILLSPATAAGLDPALLGGEKEGGRLLGAGPLVEGRLEPLPDVSSVDLAPYVPAGVRAHLATAAVEAEHRQASVAFLRFSGADRLAPEEAAAALDELVRAVQAAADAHGVCFLETDVDRDGGRIVLVAGAPQTSENDEERLLRTVRAVVEAGTTLPVAVGVNRGRVFAGEVGAAFRRTYTILGDTAALAARLMARAAPGEILAPAETVARSRTAFELTELEPFHVKGKSAPVAAVAVGPVAGTRDVRVRRTVPLVDREREMAILEAALAPVRMGFGSLVELVGDPGIGKSRIVEEVGERASDMRRVAAACERYEAATPYYPFRDLLRALLDVRLDGTPGENTAALRARVDAVAPDLAPWLPLVGLALDAEVLPTTEVDELQPAFRRARLHGVVASLLAALLDEPTLLLFEDVHWMDEASSELLRHLGTQISTRPWFTCSTRRPVEGGFSAAEGTPPLPALTLRLDPLPADDARKLVASVSETALPEDALAAITERSGGNPLFIQELVASAAGARVELPESVEAVVTARIDRLAPADRALLRWASVLGESFQGDLIAEVLAGDESAASDSEAWDRLGEFVERDPDVPGGFRFRHALLRDAAYEGLSFARRRELHARVAEVHESRHADPREAAAELLSTHFALGEVAGKAWTYSVAAGDRAKAKYANVDAAEFYRRALASAEALPELPPAARAEVWESLAEVEMRAGRLAAAAAALARARRLAPDRSQAVLALKEGRLREEMGLYSDAVYWYGRGFRALDAIPDEERRAVWRVELKMAYTQARFRQGRLADCIRLCGEIAEVAQAVGDLTNLAHAYYLLHVVHTLLGNPERTAFRGLALPIYEELGDLAGQASVLNNLGIEAYYEGRWDDSLALYEGSRALRERIGDVINVATTTNNIGEIRSDQGHLDEAVPLFEEVQRICDAAGQTLLSTVARANLGRVAARAGRHDDAEALLRAALEAFGDIKASQFVLETKARLVELLVLRGDRSEEALRLAVETLSETGGIAPLHAMLERLRGYALLQSGDAAGAAEAFEASLAVARDAGAEYETALSLRALGDPGAEEILARLGVVVVPPVPVP